MRDGPSSARERHCHARGPSRSSAIAILGLVVSRVLQPPREDRPEVAEAIDDRRRADGAEEGALVRSQPRGGGNVRGFPPLYAFAAG